MRVAAELNRPVEVISCYEAGYEGFSPRRRREQLHTGDGRELPPRLKAEIARELQRLELILGMFRKIGPRLHEGREFRSLDTPPDRVFHLDMRRTPRRIN